MRLVYRIHVNKGDWTSSVMDINVILSCHSSGSGTEYGARRSSYSEQMFVCTECASVSAAVRGACCCESFASEFN